MLPEIEATRSSSEKALLHCMQFIVPRSTAPFENMRTFHKVTISGCLFNVINSPAAAKTRRNHDYSVFLAGRLIRVRLADKHLFGHSSLLTDGYDTSRNAAKRL